MTKGLDDVDRVDCFGGVDRMEPPSAAICQGHANEARGMGEDDHPMTCCCGRQDPGPWCARCATSPGGVRFSDD
jgi:hypothetical protein